MRLITLSLIAALLTTPVYAANKASTLELVGRKLTAIDPIFISPTEANWLSKRGALNVGIILPSYEPFEVVSTTGDYEGISADVLKFIEDQIGAKITIHAYKDEKTAKKAMQVGEIDMLGIGSWLSIDDSNLLGTFSEPFLKSKLVFSSLKNRADKYKERFDGVRVAAPKGLVDKDVFSLIYPNNILLEYASPLAAIDAVYFKKADVLLSDIYSTYYLSGERFGDFTLVKYARYEPKNFNFFVSKQHPELLSIVNKAIYSLYDYGRSPILARWKGAMTEVTSDREILTPSELSFLKRNKKIKVGININNIPYTFLGHEKRIVGISRDVLDVLSDIVSIDFEIKEYNTNEDVQKALLMGQIDIIAAYKKIKHDKLINTSLSYNRDDIEVLISNKNSINDAGIFNGKTIAISDDLVSPDTVLGLYKNALITTYPNGIHALQALAKNTVDGAVTSLYQANYFLKSNNLLERYTYNDRIAGKPLEISFGLRKSDTELLKILNKIIQAVPPSDFSRISYRWRNNPLPKMTVWEVYSTELTFFLLSLSAGLFLYLMRSYMLSKELQAKRILEERLLNEINFKHTLLDGIPMPISVRDEYGKLIFCNQNFLSTFQVEKDEVMGKGISESFSNRLDKANEINDIFNRVLHSGIPSTKDLSIIYDNESRNIYQWVIPFKSPTDNVKGIICGIVDVTERKKLELQLKFEKENAEQANRAKSNFLAVMSHELRTPMNAIIGFVELALQKAKMGEPDIDSLQQASDAADTLLELIGGVLDISSAESSALTLNNKCISLNKLAQSTISLLRAMALKKNNQLLYCSTIDNRESIYIDPVRLRQIIYNVVGNALKFTDNGVIKFNLERMGEYFVLTVKDNGIGIPSDKISNIFSPFIQAHNNYESGYSGSGLGLTIVKKICQTMGGDILITSKEKQGTMVTVTLPYIACRDTASDIIQISNTNNSHIPRNILIVDDHIANRNLMEKQLEYIGCNVFSASDGLEALAIYDNESIDLIITDCQMPNMNGFELARVIREKEQALDNETVKNVVIYGLTASGLQEDYDRCLAAGMDDCLFKPFKLKYMIDKINHFSDLIEQSTHNEHHPDWKTLLYDKFIECNTQDMIAIKACIKESDNKGVSEHIHRIKGACKIIGEKDIISLCDQIEEQLKKNNVVSNVLIKMLDEKIQAMTKNK